MKPAAILLLVLLAIAALWYRSSKAAGAPAALTVETAEDAVVSPGPTELPSVSMGVSPASGSAGTERSEVEVATHLEQSRLAEAQTSTPRLQCSVVLIDTSGVERHGLSGSLTITSWNKTPGLPGNTGHSEEFEVVEGAFELELMDAVYFSASDFKLNGRGAVLVEPDQHFPSDGGPIVLRVTWPNSVRLSVVSAETGEHLTDISVVRSEGWRSNRMLHPGKAIKGRTMLSGGFSPVELEPSSREAGSTQLVCFVHSPGYAWKAISLNMSAGGEREVRLVQGGDLEIQLLGGEPKAWAMLRLFSTTEESSPPLLEVAVGARQLVEIKSLSPAIYLASFQRGEWYADPLVLGEMTVEVVAGERGEYELQWSPSVGGVSTLLAGTAVLPAEWGFDDFSIRAELDGTDAEGASRGSERQRSEMTKRADSTDGWAFDFGEVPVGSYDIELRAGHRPDRLVYGIRIAVEPGSAQSVRLEIPPPANVLLRLIDGTSGEPSGVTYIHYNSVVPSSRFRRSLTGVTAREQDGLFAFRAPIGEINLGAFGGDYTSLNETVLLHAGDNEFTFKLERNCPLTILFFDAETPVPPAENWYPRPEHLDGEGTLLFTAGGESGFRTAFSEPGRYVFEIPTIPGFEPIPEQTISVTRGEPTIHKIQLKRSPR